jgi:uncharacterized protein involved in outer membrane biogenesis
MKRISIKWILKLFTIIFLILVVVSLVAAITLQRYVPKEKIRDVITKELSNRFNQDITMSTFSVGFYPNMEFVTHSLRIVDPLSSHEILSAQEVRFDLNVRELFNRKCVIENIMVASSNLDLIRNADSAWNIEELIGSARSGEAEANTTQSVSWLEFGQIRIKNGVIRIRDEASGQHLSVSEIAATIDVRKESIYIDSASISLPPVEAELSGTVSQLSKPNPVFDIKATLRVAKEGPLADLPPADLPAGETIADVSIEASGQPNKIMLNTAFSFNKMATAGIATTGKISGILQTQEGLFEIGSLELIFGQSTLSLSGTCDNIFQNERTARLEGTAGILLEEVIALAGKDPVSKLELKGKANATIALNASMEQVDFKSDIDLLKTDLNVPQLMHKQAGTSGKLVIDAHYTIPNELVIDNFELLIDNAKLDGKLQVNPGKEPWFKTSFKTYDFPLGSLNRLPAVRFEEGVLTLFAEVWQSNQTQEGINYRGEAAIKQATLVVEAMKEPFKDLDAKINVADKKATVHAASFFFGESICRVEAEVTDFSKPQVVGQLNTDILDINKLIDAFSTSEGDIQEPTSSEATTLPQFSVEMMIRADEMHAGKVRTGAVSTILHTSGRVQRFDPVQIESFGGGIRGKFELSILKEGASWAVDFSGQGMRLEDILAQLREETAEGAEVTGLLSAKGNLTGRAASEEEEVWRSIKGELGFTITDAEFKQSSLFKSMLLATPLSVGVFLVPGLREVTLLSTLYSAAKSKGRTLKANQFFFTRIDGTFHLADGLAHTEDSSFVGETVDLRFKGDIDLVKQYFEMRARATPVGSIDSLTRKLPVIGKHLDKAKRSVLSYSFNVSGPLSEPEAQLTSVEELEPQEEEQ